MEASNSKSMKRSTFHNQTIILFSENRYDRRANAPKYAIHDRVAVKKVHKDEEADKEIFYLERVHHRNIVKFLGQFEWKNQTRIALEVCQGTLKTLVKAKKRLHSLEVAYLMRQVLSGIVYLHKKNIMHR